MFKIIQLEVGEKYNLSYIDHENESQSLSFEAVKSETSKPECTTVRNLGGSYTLYINGLKVREDKSDRIIRVANELQRVDACQ